MSGYDPRGSMWAKWDLHFHTPSSYDYEDKSVSDQDIIDNLVRAEIRVVAITDHHVIDVERVSRLHQLAGDRITILPGIELRTDQGGKPIHYICIFPPDANLTDLWTSLQGSLGLTPTEIAQKGGDDRVYVPIEEGAAKTRELNGIVTIHAGAKSNSIEGIENQEQFQQRIKFDITNKWVDLMEIGQLKDIDNHLSIIFPATRLDKGLIICSDNHNAREYRQKASLWVHANPSFRGLQMVLREPRERLYIGPRPPGLIRIEQNPTKYIKAVKFSRLPTTPLESKWFSGEVLFNPGLVAIIGNKGSGKSALADTLGLLGATQRGERFSFLNSRQFLHHTIGLGRNFKAEVEWQSGEKYERYLSDVVGPDEVERIQYLPQDHVEVVCNELAGLGGEGFEQELKAVIFSHVPDERRIGKATLDELMAFRSAEKQRRIDILLGQVREQGRQRAVLESRTDPIVRDELNKRIGQKTLELEAHNNRQPQRVDDPGQGAEPANLDLLQQLQVERRTTELAQGLAANGEATRAAERRHAVATRLLERLDNFRKEFDTFVASLEEDSSELGINAGSLATLTMNREGPAGIIEITVSRISELRREMGTAEVPGLRQQLDDADRQNAELQSRLDAPNRAYQQYLSTLKEWQQQRNVLVGSAEASESLEGLKASLAELGQVPGRIDEVKQKQMALASDILDEKLAQVAIYRELYGAVQEFINSHALSKGALRLEFRAELASENLSGRLLDMLNQNRKGSFMGTDQGRARVESLTQAVQWEERKSTEGFLIAADAALHNDQRQGETGKLLVKDQLVKGRKPEDVFELLYGLDYLSPRYVLRWDGKDLSMLSPGERGTLLLVFYLLIEKGDTPLIIDQPEGNLDNYTVAKVLVGCIKDARRHRQVFIVTHNPNLAVVCDADQVVHADIDKGDGNTVRYSSGALEDPSMSAYVTDVLEGTRWAFEVRREKYEVTRSN